MSERKENMFSLAGSLWMFAENTGKLALTPTPNNNSLALAAAAAVAVAISKRSNLTHMSSLKASERT